LHTNDAPSAVQRLLDLGALYYLLQGTLAGVMAQRLVRTLCPHCKRLDGEVDEIKWNALTYPWRADKPESIGVPVGCQECRKTGYLGRTGIYEMLKISPTLRSMIHPNTEMAKFSETARKEGMRPLRLSAATHVARGITTIEEVIGVLPTIDA